MTNDPRGRESSTNYGLGVKANTLVFGVAGEQSGTNAAHGTVGVAS